MKVSDQERSRNRKCDAANCGGTTRTQPKQEHTKTQYDGKRVPQCKAIERSFDVNNECNHQQERNGENCFHVRAAA